MAHWQGESRGSAILASVIALAITLPGCSEDHDNAYLGPEIFEMYDQFPAWSPAGDRIAFRYQARDLGEQQGIWLVDSDGQNARPLINGDLPSWSPNGKELAYVRDAQICVLILDTGETVQLTHSGRNWFPTWSPSGEMLTFDRTAPIDSAGLWIITHDGSQMTKVPGVSGRSPSWSPNGELLAYESYTDEIHVVRVDGSENRKVSQTFKPSRYPKWSPDGRYIAYGTADGVRLIDMVADEDRLIDGTRPDMLLSYLTSTGWSPDGRWLVYSKQYLWITRLDGTENRPFIDWGTEQQ